MNTFVSNLVSLVVLPSLVVTGFLYVVCRLLAVSMADRSVGTKRTAFLALVIGIYFLGHPLYPALVPLIRASTSWVFAAGGTYVTVGLTSFACSRYPRFSTVEAWITAVLGATIPLLVANGVEFGTIARLVEGNDFDLSLYLSLPLALMFPFGYEYHLDDGRRRILPLVLVASSYGLVLANAVPLTERVRGPLALVFVAYGCIGVLLGIPLYVLGAALASSPNER